MRAPDREPARWGVRTLGFLFAMFLAVAVSSLQGHYTPVSLTLLIGGVFGAMVCSLRGLMTASWRPPAAPDEPDYPGGATESRTITGQGK